jgi:hypothetical protein
VLILLLIYSSQLCIYTHKHVYTIIYPLLGRTFIVLQVALGDIQTCLPSASGRGIDAGCFMRYSNVRFFGANQTTDLTLYLKSGICR